MSAGAIWDELKGDYPDLVGTRLQNVGGTVRDGAPTIACRARRVQLVDPSFFDVFDLPLAAGDRAALLKSPDEVVLTQSRARERFGDQNPIGRRVTLAFQGQTHEFRVVGVLKDPPRSTDLPWTISCRCARPRPRRIPAGRAG